MIVDNVQSVNSLLASSVVWIFAPRFNRMEPKVIIKAKNFEESCSLDSAQIGNRRYFQLLKRHHTLLHRIFCINLVLDGMDKSFSFLGWTDFVEEGQRNFLFAQVPKSYLLFSLSSSLGVD
ncbi:Hypothetical protein NTJ_08114 [Nesidiocoris tenuis]|uniref:Uncharacterized protein n=1 Tax=Nesidiocoris tenuis TaxID=355587 RepID=A0ABN7ASX1_9HEMI|nr:Hypothetical protein NTJ_08114 [Nesidiocoris tenuis]